MAERAWGRGQQLRFVALSPGSEHQFGFVGIFVFWMLIKNASREPMPRCPLTGRRGCFLTVESSAEGKQISKMPPEMFTYSDEGHIQSGQSLGGKYLDSWIGKTH